MRRKPAAYGKMSRMIANPAKSIPAVGTVQSRQITLNEIFKQNFISDYQQVMLRFSNAARGLKFGSPPMFVSA
jgi:hypothetical protein